MALNSDERGSAHHFFLAELSDNTGMMNNETVNLMNRVRHLIWKSHVEKEHSLSVETKIEDFIRHSRACVKYFIPSQTYQLNCSSTGIKKDSRVLCTWSEWIISVQSATLGNCYQQPLNRHSQLIVFNARSFAKGLEISAYWVTLVSMWKKRNG